MLLNAPAPSAWVTRWASLLRPGGRALDVACGSGRHVRWLHERGFRVTCVDRDAAAVAALGAVAETVVADIEVGPWPFAGRQFDAVIVTNYLWRPLWPSLFACLAPGGLWIHETFASGHEAFGKPSRPAFLLRPGELLRVAHAAPAMRVIAFEDGIEDDPKRCVQRIAALREPAAAPPLPGREVPWPAR